MATEHRLGAEHVHHRWNAALPPALTIRDGDTVHFDCLESSGGQLTRHSTLADFLRIDRGLIHALAGPVYVEGAQPGDVLEIHIRRVRHGGWGWTSVFPGMGLLPERFKEPFFFVWELTGTFSDTLFPATVPLQPFCGVMGVAPVADGEIPTRPPGPFGGNMDVRDLTAGATLYLPVQRPGALFLDGRRARGAGGRRGVPERDRSARGSDAAVPSAPGFPAGRADGRDAAAGGADGPRGGGVAHDRGERRPADGGGGGHVGGWWISSRSAGACRRSAPTCCAAR